ncbi:ATP-binding protein [Phaeovulum vinaykumarii]|nr:ATP-binding protein [Phaeovulum vinaykumarii]
MPRPRAAAETETPDPGRADRRPGAPQIFVHSCNADPLAVRDALAAAVARFVDQLSREEAGTLELVLAEVMNNIVEHSYGERHEGTITLSIVRDRRGLSCSVSDDGVPLPPICLDEPRLPSTDVAREHLPEGGFGWFLIRDMTRDLGYHRENGRNLLAFRLPLAAPAG